MLGLKIMVTVYNFIGSLHSNYFLFNKKVQYQTKICLECHLTLPLSSQPSKRSLFDSLQLNCFFFNSILEFTKSELSPSQILKDERFPNDFIVRVQLSSIFTSATLNFCIFRLSLATSASVPVTLHLIRNVLAAF